MSQYATTLARSLGCTPDELRDIELGGRVHDIGKIGVREDVLHKPKKLTDDEYAHIMTHPVIGARILAPLLAESPIALNIVRSHHERFDGRGVPDKLVGTAIPLEARIVAAADAFDAMTSDRPYRPDGVKWEDAIEEMRRGRGTQFDPAVVDAFLQAVEDGSLTLLPRTSSYASPAAPAVNAAPPNARTFEVLALDALAELSVQSGLETVTLAVHRHDTDVVEQRYAWKAGRVAKSWSVRESAPGSTVRIPWRESLIRACKARGIRHTANLHRDLPSGTAVHTTGYETFVYVPAGRVTGADLYLTGASRESLVLGEACLQAADTLARTLETHACEHERETRQAVLVDHAGSGPPRDAAASRTRQVAIVDDDPIFHCLGEAALGADYRVLTYEDGASALRGFRQSRPDVVLLDIDMPAMSGHDVLEAIREDDGLREIPVIAFSSRATNALEFARAGFDGALNKMHATPSLIAASVALFADGHARNYRPRLSPRSAAERVAVGGWAAFNERSALARARVASANHGSIRLLEGKMFAGLGCEHLQMLCEASEPLQEDAPHTALEFLAVRQYASLLHEAGLSRQEALTAFREIGLDKPPHDATRANVLARLEAACIEVFDAL